MPVDSRSIESANMLPIWQRIEDTLSGRDAVLANSYTYLPPTERMTRDPNYYTAYCSRALLLPASSRTVEAFIGTIFRKPMMSVLPRQYEPRRWNIDAQGTDLESFARMVVREVLSYGRVGILVDAPVEPSFNEPISLLPYLCCYRARDIYSSRTRFTYSGRVLDQVIVRELHEAPSEDGFGTMSQEKFRVMELDERGFYRVRLFHRIGRELLEISEPIYPFMSSGQPLNYIPFTFITPDNSPFRCAKPPILDIVDVNLAHYRSSAELENGRYWTSQPTVVIEGLDEPMSWVAGGGVTMHLPTGATAKMLEFSGQGLLSLENALKEKQEYMSMLGSQMLAAPKREAETAEALTIKHGAETSTLVSIADSVSAGLTNAIAQACEFERRGGGNLVSIALNRDFVNTKMSANDLRELVRTVQAGLLPMDAFLWNLQQGEILQPGVTIEETKAQLETQAPQFSFTSLDREFRAANS